MGMTKKIEAEYIEHPDEEARIRRLAEILGVGVYTHLKTSGLLRIDPQRKEKARELIDKSREITRQTSSIGEGQ